MKKQKMNFLYKLGFILLMICIPMLIAAIVTAYLFERTHFSAVFSAGGAFLAFIGIILTMFSKPKKQKEKITEEIENSVDND
ncbi:MAG: hypothetical protein U0L76_02790 [Ruminococcus sp.]|nr:hypothetical protein [Ruminococcus sp.]